MKYGYTPPKGEKNHRHHPKNPNHQLNLDNYNIVKGYIMNNEKNDSQKSESGYKPMRNLAKDGYTPHKQEKQPSPPPKKP